MKMRKNGILPAAFKYAGKTPWWELTPEQQIAVKKRWQQDSGVARRIIKEIFPEGSVDIGKMYEVFKAMMDIMEGKSTSKIFMEVSPLNNLEKVQLMTRLEKYMERRRIE